MRGNRHWSETLACSCGKRFRTINAEARHRHNFPLLCRPPLEVFKFQAEGGYRVTIRSRLGEEDARAKAARMLRLRAVRDGRELPDSWGLRLVARNLK